MSGYPFLTKQYKVQTHLTQLTLVSPPYDPLHDGQYLEHPCLFSVQGLLNKLFSFQTSFQASRAKAFKQRQLYNNPPLAQKMQKETSNCQNLTPREQIC